MFALLQAAPVDTGGLLTFHIDLGQIIIGCLIAIIGWLIKTEVAGFKDRLDKHDKILFDLVSDVQRLIGLTTAWNGKERRSD